MTTRILTLLREQTLGALALFVALSGTAYAATALPRNSVGPAQIRTGAVRSVDVGDGSLLRRDFRRGQIPAGPRGPRGLAGSDGADGAPGPAALALATGSFMGTRELGSIGGFTFSAVCGGDSTTTGGTLQISGEGTGGVTRFTELNNGAVTTSQAGFAVFGGPTAVVDTFASGFDISTQSGVLRIMEPGLSGVVTVSAEIRAYGASFPVGGCEVVGTAVRGLPPA